VKTAAKAQRSVAWRTIFVGLAGRISFVALSSLLFPF